MTNKNYKKVRAMIITCAQATANNDLYDDTHSMILNVIEKLDRERDFDIELQKRGYFSFDAFIRDLLTRC